MKPLRIGDISKHSLMWWFLIVSCAAIFLLGVNFSFNAVPVSPNRISDTLLDHLPAAVFLRYSVLEQHQFPFWRETILNGQPFAGISLYKTAYPFQWLVLLTNPTTHISVMVILHAVIAGIGMAVWTKAQGLGIEARAFATIAFVFTPKLVAHVNGELDLVYALAWLPWLMTAAKWFLNKATVLTSLYISLFAALMLLADIRLSFFGYLLVFGYLIFESIRNHKVKNLLWGFPIALITFVLVAAVILPFLAWRPYIDRANMSIESASLSSFDIFAFVGILAPVPFVDILYFSLPVFELALIAISANWRMHIYWLLVAGFVVLYGMGANSFFWITLVRLFPALLWFRIPSRAWFLLAFCVPFMAGVGIEHLLKLQSPGVIEKFKVRYRTQNFLRIIIIVSLFVAILTPFVSGVPATYFIPFSTSLLVGGVAGSYLILRLLLKRVGPHIFLFALMLIVFIDLAQIDRTYVIWQGEQVWLDPYKPLAEKLASENAFRVYATDTKILPQYAAEIFHLRVSGGISPFIFNGTAQAIAQGGGFALPDDYFMSLPSTNKQDLLEHPNTAILGKWGVTHVISKFPLQAQYLKLIDMVDGVYIYSNQDPNVSIPVTEPLHWPDGWSDLPSEKTIQQINQLTFYAHIISFSGLSIVTVIIALLAFRRRKIAQLSKQLTA